MVRFGELEQEDARGEVVDVGQAERDEGGGELVRDNADVEGREALLHDCLLQGTLQRRSPVDLMFFQRQTKSFEAACHSVLVTSSLLS